MTAVWTQPRTYTAGETLTKAIMDQHWRDNFEFLKTPPAIAPVFLAADFTTSSASFTDITGFTATLTSYGGGFRVEATLILSNGTNPARADFDIMVDGVSESGTTQGLASHTITAAGRTCLVIQWHVTAKAAGSHTIKLRCLTSTGTLTLAGSTTGNVKSSFYVVEEGG